MKVTIYNEALMMDLPRKEGLRAYLIRRIADLLFDLLMTLLRMYMSIIYFF